MTTHHIKIHEQFVDAILTGTKTFEVRDNDREYQKGDLVKFKTYNKDGCQCKPSAIDDKVYVITYVLSGWGIKEGYVVFSFKESDERGNIEDPKRMERYLDEYINNQIDALKWSDVMGQHTETEYVEIEAKIEAYKDVLKKLKEIRGECDDKPM